MGDMIKMLFGGSSSNQQQQATSQGWSHGQSFGRPIDLNPMAFQNARTPFIEMLMQKGANPDTYNGPLNSPLGANEKDLLDQLMPMTGPGTTRSGYLENVLQGNFLPGQGGNPFLDEAIRSAQRPTMDALTEVLGRTLPGRFTAAGQFIQPQGSSAFDRSAAIATRGAADAMGDIATKMSFGNYEAERGRQQEAVGLAREEVNATISNLQSQALPRLINELGIERGLALFQQKTQSLLETLKILAAVTAPTIGNETGSEQIAGQQSSSSGSGSSTAYKGIFDSIKPFGGPSGSG